MKTKEELLKTPEYWFETIQNEIFRQLVDYMEVNKISRTKLAEEMKVSKGYITQILNGDFNCSLRKLIELSLFIKKVPIIDFKPIENVILENDSLENNIHSKINDVHYFIYTVDVVKDRYELWNGIMKDVDIQSNEAMEDGLEQMTAILENKFEDTIKFNDKGIEFFLYEARTQVGNLNKKNVCHDIL